MNETIDAYWPCPMAMFLGKFLFGAGAFIPNLCVCDAEAALKRIIRSRNRTYLADKGVEIVYVKGWSTSWLELRETEKFVPIVTGTTQETEESPRALEEDI